MTNLDSRDSSNIVRYDRAPSGGEYQGVLRSQSLILPNANCVLRVERDRVPYLTTFEIQCCTAVSSAQATPQTGSDLSRWPSLCACFRLTKAACDTSRNGALICCWCVVPLREVTGRRGRLCCLWIHVLPVSYERITYAIIPGTGTWYIPGTSLTSSFDGSALHTCTTGSAVHGGQKGPHAMMLSELSQLLGSHLLGKTVRCCIIHLIHAG